MLRKFIFTLSFLFFSFFFSRDAFSKDYYFPIVKAIYSINQDGSINVAEERTYAFTGSFSWADIYIPLKVSRKGDKYNVRITNFRISENGKPVNFSSSVDQNGKFYARWTYSAYNETRTFDLSYTLVDVLSSGQDFVEFYWQVIGDQWEKRTDQAEILVTFPATIPKNQVYAFAHGPTNGKFDFVSDNSVQFTVENIRPKQFVEVRLVFPRNSFANLVASNKKLTDVFAEEKRYLALNSFLRFLQFFPIGITFVWAVFWFFMWKKYGREYGFFRTPKYLHEPPSELSPALVEMLLSQSNTITHKSFTATILDLARRKYSEIHERRYLSNFLLFSLAKNEYAIVIKKSLKDVLLDNKLNEFERLLIDQLSKIPSVFSDEETVGFALSKASLTSAVKVTDLKKEMKRSDFRSFWQQFQEKVKDQAKKLNFVEQGSIRKNNYFLISFALIIIMHVFALNYGIYSYFGFKTNLNFWNLIQSTIYGMLLVLFLVSLSLRLLRIKLNLGFMKRWTITYGSEAKKWESFKNFLENFAKFKGTLPEMLPVWEKYLVFGTLFGFADKILKLMPLALGERTPAWYVSSSQGGISASFGDFSSGISSISSSVSSGFSAGSGGGFSGGGGGGGAG